MARSSQDSSSNRASHNKRFIRRVHNSENRRTPYGTEHLHSPMRRRYHRRGNPSQISFQFTGTTHMHTAIAMMDAESFSLPPVDGSFVMPTHEARPQYLRTSVGGTGVRISAYSSPGNNPQPPLSFRYVQTPPAGRGSSSAGYRQRTQIADNIGRFGPAPFLHTDVAGPEYPRDWCYPQASGGLYNGGFTSGAQIDAVRPGSVTGVQTPAVGLGPAVPGPNIGPTPFLHTDVAGPEYPRDRRIPQPSGGLYNGGFTSGAQMDAVGLGPAGSSGVGYNQLSPIATLGFAGQTSQAPIVPEHDSFAGQTSQASIVPEHDTQAAATPPTLDQQLFPTSWATAANNVFAEDFLAPAVSDNFMHMLDQI